MRFVIFWAFISYLALIVTIHYKPALATEIIAKIMKKLKPNLHRKIRQLNTTTRHQVSSGGLKIDILFSAPVFVNCTTLLARLCLTRTLQCTVAFSTALFTCGTVAFQTASSTGTALLTSVSLTDNGSAVTGGTAEFTFCGRFTCHVTIST